MVLEKPNGKTRQEFGRPLPDFSLCLLDGSNERTLRDYLTDKSGAVIVFWSAICTHCRHYDEYFKSFAWLHPQLGFTAIASRYSETEAQMRIAIKQRQLVFPVLLDQSGEVARQWHSQQTPRCYLVSSDSRLVYRGAIDNFKSRSDKEYLAFLDPVIKAYLAGQPIPRTETASFGCAIETTYYHLPSQL